MGRQVWDPSGADSRMVRSDGGWPVDGRQGDDGVCLHGHVVEGEVESAATLAFTASLLRFDKRLPGLGGVCPVVT